MQDGFSIRPRAGQQEQLLRDVNAFDRELGKSLARNIRKIAIPVGRRMIRDIGPEIPARGGLRARVLAAKVGASVRTGSAKAGAGASLVFRKPRVLRYIDQGVIPHPVFPKAGESRSAWTWRTQSIRAHGLTDGFEKEAPELKGAVEHAVREAAKTIKAGRVS